MVTIERKMGASIPELARETGLSESLLYGLAKGGRLPGCRRVGRRFVIHVATFNAWLQSGHGDEGEEGPR